LGRIAPDDIEWQDEDVKAVRKIFRAVSNETLRAAGNLQVIVLDHADDKVWGDTENIILVEEWHGGEKLVPEIWLVS
jgi:quinol monooxygenase YgiN